MIIQHNIMSLNAHRQLGGNTSLVSKNLEKLSSGFKINRAGDDAAGLAISEKMRAQITGLTRAQSNAQDGISLVQTAEGALTEVHSMLNRMVDLATQSSNGTMQGDDRQKIQDEMDSLTGEIDRISKSTNFNGINLLDGSLGGAGNTPKVSAATIAGATVAISETQATASKHTVTIADGGTNTGDVSLDITYVGADGKDVKVSVGAYAPGADVALTAGTKALVDAINNDAKLNGLFTASMKADGSELYLTSKATGKAALEIKSVSNTQTTTPALAVTTSSATNTVASADRTFSVGMGALAAGDAITIDGKTYEFLADPTTAKKGNIGVQFTTDLAGSLTAFNAELKKNGVVATNNAGTVSFTSDPAATAKGLVLQIGDTADEFNKVTVAVDDMGRTGLGIDAIDVKQQTPASEAIKTIKTAIEKVSKNRSAMGALQNRLEHTINNLGVATENMTAAESRVRDVDMAKEMANFTKNNVLTQAAQAMLAQANQQPQQVLQLLR